MLQRDLIGLAQRTNRDWALFGQKIIVSALAFLIVFILVQKNLISYSTKK
jgi:ABC-type maltose transport system permease subunit